MISPLDNAPLPPRVPHGSPKSKELVTPAAYGSVLYNDNGAYHGLVHSESTVTVEKFWKNRLKPESRPGGSSDSSASGSSNTDEAVHTKDPWALPELREEEEVLWQDLSTFARIRHALVNWIIKPVLVVTLLYLFICSLDFLSSAFQLLGGKVAGQVFVDNPFLSNPVCGLMIGLLSTVLVQSSSTSTSITVTMVASEILTVRVAIPIIMGANIGTSITNTIVSLAQSADKHEFRRAFAGATVHDMFNWLCVIVLLPLETCTGYLYYSSKAIVESFHIQEGGPKGEETEFLKHLTQPFTSRIIQLDKEIIGQIAIGSNDPHLMTASLRKQWCGYEDYWDIETNTTIKNGTERCQYLFNSDALSDTVAGVILLGFSLLMLCGCLVLMVKVLNSLLRGSVAQSIRKFINNDFPGVFRHLTGYAAILVGAGLTIIMQSSSVFTSALTPLVGVGVITLERMYPLTLGSNLGTTGTGVLAALASSGGKQLEAALQIAFCHLLFNISGILLFYPIPFTRVPIQLARIMGNTTAKYRWFALLYLVVMYFALPGMVFILSLHPVAMYLIGVPSAILLVCVVFVNVLQRKYPRILPDTLKNWKKLPVWMRSLEPYDRGVRKLYCCACCAACCGDEDERGGTLKVHQVNGKHGRKSARTKGIKRFDDGRLLSTFDAESQKILLGGTPVNSAPPSRVTSSAHLPLFCDREREGDRERFERLRKLSSVNATSVV